MAFRQVNVDATVRKLAAFEPKRRTLSLVNLGTARLFVSYDEQNIIAEGFPVDPGVMLSFSEIDGDDARLALFGQTAGTSDDVRVEEGFVHS